MCGEETSEFQRIIWQRLRKELKRFEAAEGWVSVSVSDPH
jgi:hypothetical protein